MFSSCSLHVLDDGFCNGHGRSTASLSGWSRRSRLVIRKMELKDGHREMRRTHVRTSEASVQVLEGDCLNSKSLIEALHRAADLHRQSASADLLVARRLEELAGEKGSDIG